ncbi:hypothetical protein ACVW0I_003262 [Bradyrhizobium sp. LM6.11]
MPDLLVQRNRPRELGTAEAQTVGAGRIGREPLRIDIEHEENGAAFQIGWQEIMRLPWIDRDDRTFGEFVMSLADIDASGTSPDMEDQMTFAMCVDVERAVQLIDRRPAKAAVEDGERPAHAFPPKSSCRFLVAFNNRGENARAHEVRALQISPKSAIAREQDYVSTSYIPVLYGLANRSWRTPRDRSRASG